MCYTPVMKLPRVKKLKRVKNGAYVILIFHFVKNGPYLRVLQIDISDLN
jgi:hypothetical protein